MENRTIENAGSGHVYVYKDRPEVGSGEVEVATTSTRYVNDFTFNVRPLPYALPNQQVTVTFSMEISCENDFTTRVNYVLWKIIDANGEWRQVDVVRENSKVLGRDKYWFTFVTGKFRSSKVENFRPWLQVSCKSGVIMYLKGCVSIECANEAVAIEEDVDLELEGLFEII